MNGRVGIAAAFFLMLLAPVALAQSSASYSLTEHSLNAGGRPADGVVAASASYQITLDAIGQSVVGGLLSGSSYSVEGGFAAAFPPPGEVLDLMFVDRDTLTWSPERSVGVYNLYRDPLRHLDQLGYGDCLERAISGETATDTEVPSTAGDGFFYLVTAENRIDEEGPKGTDSSGTARSNPAPCP